MLQKNRNRNLARSWMWWRWDAKESFRIVSLSFVLVIQYHSTDIQVRLSSDLIVEVSLNSIQFSSVQLVHNIHICELNTFIFSYFSCSGVAIQQRRNLVVVLLLGGGVVCCDSEWASEWVVWSEVKCSGLVVTETL